MFLFILLCYSLTTHNTRTQICTLDHQNNYTVFSWRLDYWAIDFLINFLRQVRIVEPKNYAFQAAFPKYAPHSCQLSREIRDSLGFITQSLSHNGIVLFLLFVPEMINFVSVYYMICQITDCLHCSKNLECIFDARIAFFFMNILIQSEEK